jgi:hypothetical protein
VFKTILFILVIVSISIVPFLETNVQMGVLFGGILPVMVAFFLYRYFFDYQQYSPENVYYLEPRIITGWSCFYVFVVITIHIFVIVYYLPTYLFWDTYKCKSNNFYMAPLFGEKSVDAIKDCMQLNLDDQIQQSLQPQLTKIQNLEQKIQTLEKTSGHSLGDIFSETAKSSTERMVKIGHTLNEFMKTLSVNAQLDNSVLTSSQTLDQNIQNEMSQYKNISAAMEKSSSV